MKSAMLGLLGLTLVGAACSSDSGGGNSSEVPPLAVDGSLTLEAPENGLQLAMPPFNVPAGQDIEYCYGTILEADTDININTFRAQYREGSHHFILYASDDPAEGFPDGQLAQCGQGVDEFSANMLDFHPLYGTQLMAETLTFPEGIAVRVKAGAAVIMNSHYFNYTEDDLVGEVRVNLVGIPDDAVAHEADNFLWFNPFIYIKPGENFSTDLTCSLPPGTEQATMLTHTHQLGTKVEVFSAIDGGTERLLHTESDWQHPATVVYDQPYQWQAGEKFRFQCDFENPTDGAVMVGTSSKDEMCVISGYYYPKVESTDGPGGFGGGVSCFEEIVRRAVTGDRVPVEILVLFQEAMENGGFDDLDGGGL